MNVGDEANIQQGVLDLNTLHTNKGFQIKLSGEWELYTNTLLISESQKSVKPTYSHLPESWSPYFHKQDGIHYGSYRLTILKEHTDVPQMYGITIPDGLTPYEVYVNKKLIGGLGNMTLDNIEAAPVSRPATYYFMLDAQENEIIIQGIQANPYTDGGMTKEIILGDLQSMSQARFIAVIAQILFCIIFLFYILFILLLWVIGFRNKALIYFAVIIITTIATALVSSNKLLYIYLPFNWIWGQKLYFLTYINNMLFFILFLRELVKEYIKSKALLILSLCCGIYLAFTLIAPIEYILKMRVAFLLLFIVSPILMTIYMFIAVAKGGKGSVFLALAGVATANNSLFVLLQQNSTAPYSHYPFDLLIAATAISAFWFARYYDTTIETEKLSLKLQKEIHAKDEFLANTSHELRNPLHGMMSITQLLLNKQENDDLKLLLSIGRHMSHVLDDLLDLVQLKEQTLRLYPKAIQIHDVAQRMKSIFAFRLSGKPIQLIVNIPIDTPVVWADEIRVIQIFTNLLHNAIKFTEEGSITLTAEKKGSMLYISITDTGIGIDKELQKRIFEPYEQADSSMTAVGGGLGLGLSICKDLIVLHGGTLSLSSEIGKGSTFTFSLPITKKQIDNDTIPEPSHTEAFDKYTSMVNNIEQEIAAIIDTNPFITSRPRILIVDDDPVNLQVLVNVLSTEPYDVETALNGAEAIKKLQNTIFDLVISDIMMPNMSGYELAQHIRKQFTISELPILFLTAKQQHEDIQLAFISGANDFVKKPMEYVEFKARVQALVRMKLSNEERLRIEAAWLQAQIQPHFFFNTLNSIISLHGVDDEQMEELLLAFSDYLQMSFDFQNADLVVPIDYELKLVRSYLIIEQIRFGDRIQVVWNLPDTLELHVPPLVIQTLVENAIQHGILPRREGGIITIRITESEKDHTVAITDNGVGFNTAVPRKKTSVGLMNTEQRLKQIFGTKLVIESHIGDGTTISFTIPTKTTGEV
ncbi:ATP-binding protein [Lysinibacillus piscis]|nr:ATP-binding protein [Lysinibacillus sp. KH24]